MPRISHAGQITTPQKERDGGYVLLEAGMASNKGAATCHLTHDAHQEVWLPCIGAVGAEVRERDQ